MIADKNIIYNSGADMWHDTISQYGETEARKICNNYLHMQVFNKDSEEDKFCCELYAAMRDTFVKNVSKSSILDELTDNKKLVQDISSKPQEKKKDKDIDSHL